ncbi:MAG: AAA family ATPase [Anaerolineae bacterium]
MKKLLQLDVKRFRSLYDITWTPGDINVIIGPNGSGKSNLLKVFELLAVSARGGLGKYVQREGGMEPLVWDGQEPQISFQVKTAPVGAAMPELESERYRLTYQLELLRLGLSSAYRIEHELLGNFYRVHTGEKEQPMKFLERTPRSAVVFDEREKRLDAPEEAVPEEETLLSMASGPFAANRTISHFQNELASWRVYQDFQVHREAPVRQPTLARSETSVAPDGANLISVLHTLYTGSRDFKHGINAAMRVAFGDDFDELIFPPAADQRIQLRVRWKSLRREQTAADLSDGTLRFLFLLAILVNPNPPGLIAIDEPETGLHPSMLPIIAEYASDAALKSQVILTTHSAEFLDAFGDTPPTTTVAQWQEGRTHLRILSDEALDYWLKRYTLGRMYRSGELEALA